MQHDFTKYELIKLFLAHPNRMSQRTELEPCERGRTQRRGIQLQRVPAATLSCTSYHSNDFPRVHCDRVMASAAKLSPAAQLKSYGSVLNSADVTKVIHHVVRTPVMSPGSVLQR